MKVDRVFTIAIAVLAVVFLLATANRVLAFEMLCDARVVANGKTIYHETGELCDCWHLPRGMTPFRGDIHVHPVTSVNEAQRRGWSGYRRPWMQRCHRLLYPPGPVPRA